MDVVSVRVEPLHKIWGKIIPASLAEYVVELRYPPVGNGKGEAIAITQAPPSVLGTGHWIPAFLWGLQQKRRQYVDVGGVSQAEVGVGVHVGDVERGNENTSVNRIIAKEGTARHGSQ